MKNNFRFPFSSWHPFDYCIVIYISDFSHFENDIIGSFGNSIDDNASMEYIVSSSSDSSSSPITGAPISFGPDDADPASNYLANNIDFGEFLDSAADIYPNKLKHAVCGKLTIKYIILITIPYAVLTLLSSV